MIRNKVCIPGLRKKRGKNWQSSWLSSLSQVLLLFLKSGLLRFWLFRSIVDFWRVQVPLMGGNWGAPLFSWLCQVWGSVMGSGTFWASSQRPQSLASSAFPYSPSSVWWEPFRSPEMIFWLGCISQFLGIRSKFSNREFWLWNFIVRSHQKAALLIFRTKIV